MKKLIALLIGVAFVAGLSGSALAQGTTAPKEEKKPAAAAPADKKPAAHNASGTVKTAAADSIVVAGKTKGADQGDKGRTGIPRLAISTLLHKMLRECRVTEGD